MATKNLVRRTATPAAAKTATKPATTKVAAKKAPPKKASPKKAELKKSAAPKSAAKSTPVKKSQVPSGATVTPKELSAEETRRSKPKLVRDSFTIPKPEYAVLAALKERALRLERHSKKGELLRAGIKALDAMSDAAFLVALDAVPAIKTGRPKAKDAAKSTD